MKEKIRLSFDIPIDEHTIYKMECAKSRVKIKDFIHNLMQLGMKEYKKAQFEEKLEKSIQQAKNGDIKEITTDQLKNWEKELEDRDGI